jgi:hypothetical protein
MLQAQIPKPPAEPPSEPIPGVPPIRPPEKPPKPPAEEPPPPVHAPQHFAQADFESTERDLSFGVPTRERLTRDRAVRCLQESGATLQTTPGAQEDRSLGSAADAGLALVDRALMW